MTEEQLTEAFRILKDKGVKHFGIHAFLASNTVPTNIILLWLRSCLNWQSV